MQRISKKQLAQNLQQAAGLTDGKRGLNILIYGWLRYRKYGNRYRDKLYHRDWLFIVEVIDLSDYAGCDLRH